MRLRYGAGVLLAACAASLVGAADPPAISGDKQVDAGKLVRLSISNLPPKAGVIWDISPEANADPEELPPGKMLFSGLAGAYGIKARVIEPQPDGTLKITTLRWQATIGQAPDPSPNPPGPGPGPNPPGDIPFAGAPGLRVLIVVETADQAKYPPALQNVLFGKAVRDYLRAKCPADTGGFYGWAIWDKDTDTGAAPKAWQDAFKRPRQSLPWLVVSNGKQFYEGPVPGTADEALTLLKKYGGN